MAAGAAFVDGPRYPSDAPRGLPPLTALEWAAFGLDGALLCEFRSGDPRESRPLHRLVEAGKVRSVLLCSRCHRARLPAEFSRSQRADPV